MTKKKPVKTSKKAQSTKKPKTAKKTGNRPSASKQKKARRALWLRGVKWLFVLGLWGGIFLALLFAWYAQDLPDIAKNAGFERETSITILAADGSEIARYGEIRGNSITTADLPPHLIYAVLATEDRRFYQHHGIDPVGLARAMAVNLRSGRLVQGGSTITQQLAKNLFLSHERTFKRKIQEAMLALWLEHELTKDEILSAYLNRVYLGSGTYGVDAASKLYFKKNVQAIDIRESATLAGLLKAPSRYSPLRNPGLSKERTDIVLSAMVDAGYLTREQAESYEILPPAPSRKPSTGSAIRYYADWIVDELNEMIGTPNEDLIVTTTLSPVLQSVTEDSLSRTIREDGEDKKFSQGAAIVMRPDGAVLAMSGGLDYTLSQFNRATQARRPPGSAFKPVVYLAALENGWKPAYMINDSPITEGAYRPKNFGQKYYGEVTLEEALTLSMNTAAVRLMKEVGVSPVVDLARRLGITADLAPDLSLALGSSGISLLEMSGAYAILANGGGAVTPYGITKISTLNGDLYYQRPERQAFRRVIESRPVRDITDMLASVVEEGTGRGAHFGKRAAGKTGTSQDNRDAWFIGFTDELVTGVWLGNDDNSPMEGVTGGSYPARIWREIMSKGDGLYEPDRRGLFSSSSFESLLGRLIPIERDKSALPESRRYNN